MEAISKSEPIFTKLCTHYSRLNSVRFAKIRANRMIFRGLLHHLPKIGRNYIWELYVNLNRFSRNISYIILDLIQYSIPNFVQIERYIGTIYIKSDTNIYIYVGAISKSEPIFMKLSTIILDLIQYAMPKFMQIE